MNEKNGPTVDEIVEWLRSSDPTERGEALDALMGGCDGGALLVTVGPEQAQVTASGQCDAGRLFNVLLALAQTFGAHIGVHLQWVKDPDDPSKIVVPAGMQFFQ